MAKQGDDSAMPAPEYTTSLEGSLAIMREIGKITFEANARDWFERAAPGVVAELKKHGVIFPDQPPMPKLRVELQNKPLEMALAHCFLSACHPSMPCSVCKHLAKEIQEWFDRNEFYCDDCGKPLQREACNRIRKCNCKG